MNVDKLVMLSLGRAYGKMLRNSDTPLVITGTLEFVPVPRLNDTSLHEAKLKASVVFWYTCISYER